MKDHSGFYKELNAQQKLAVDMIDGPLLVLAGPGTGKTQLLSIRAASILKHADVRAGNILILTYTNSAAKAMKERLARILGPSGYDVEVGTFHSFANSIIQDSIEAANYVGDKIQMTDVEKMRAFEFILDNTPGLDEIRPFRAPYTYVKEAITKISEMKKDGIAPADFEKYLHSATSQYHDLDDKYIKRLRALSIVYKRYEDLKSGKTEGIFDERGRYDFDDMIIFATEALKKEPGLKDEYAKQYSYVMVDEFQDTNGSQMALLFTLLDSKKPNLCCVGDDDQSIYRFQGASVGNFKMFTQRFPGMKTISLKDNYRSSKELIGVAARLISLIPIKERAGQKTLEAVKDYNDKEIVFKEFTTETEELICIIDKVRDLKEKIEKDKSLSAEDRADPYSNIAVLVRKRSDILKVIDAFLQAGIPYATDGKEDISGERRVKQLMDVLELAHIDPKEHEQKDLSLYKVLTADYFQIPQADVLRFISFVNNKKKTAADKDMTILGEFLNYFGSRKTDIKLEKPDRMRQAAEVISHLLDDANARPVHSMLMDYIKNAGLFKYILREYRANAVLRIRQIRGLTSFVNMIKASDLARPAIRLDEFMEELKVRKDHDLPVQGSLVTLTQAGVRVYTAHGSKGLEFHTVIIPFCLHNKNWPARRIPEKIQLPSDLFKTKERIKEKETMRQLAIQDETRLFYVAMTRARSSLIFTASPTEDTVSSLYLNELDIEKDSPELVEEEVASKSLEMTDAEDPFIGTEAVLKDMISNMSLNPTRLNTYISCRRRFLYNDVLKLPAAKKKSLVFGNCVHKALEDTYTEYMNKKKFPSFRFFKDSFDRELKFQGVDRTMERELLNKAETIKDWFAGASKDPIMPVSLERKLVITVGDNIIFTGKYDKVEWADEDKGLVRIVDYKTGKPDHHLKTIDEVKDLASGDCDGYLRQLVCYKLLFEKDKKESKGRRVHSGALVFIEPVSADLRKQGYKKGQHAVKSVDITEEMVWSLEDVIKDAWRNIMELRFEQLPERDDDKCRTCDFDGLCWGRQDAQK